MRVELDIFSGRPNPVWELDAQDTATLIARLDSLRGTVGAIEPPVLGYRGFVYRSQDRTGRAYRGVIDTRDTPLADPTGEIERFLLSRLPDAWRDVRPFVERAVLDGD